MLLIILSILTHLLQPSTSADFTDEQSAKEWLTDNYGEFTIEQVQKAVAAVPEDSVLQELVGVDTFFKLAQKIQNVQGVASISSCIIWDDIKAQSWVVKAIQGQFTTNSMVTFSRVGFIGPIAFIHKNVFAQIPSHMTSLDITNCHFITLPSSLRNLKQLDWLNLPYNSLPTVPDEIFDLTGLQELYLYENQLSRLSPKIGHLTELKKLDLHSNQLRELPKEIGHLTKLEVLRLHNNKLSQLPEEISRLTGLRELLLDDNNLTHLPEEIGHLTGLVEMSVYKNPLTSLPSSLGGNIQDLTRRLYMDKSQLSILPAGLQDKITIIFY